MPKWTRRVVMVSVGLLAGVAGAAVMIMLVIAMSRGVLKNPHDATSIGNWFFWIACISAGLGLLAIGFYAGHRWRLDRDEGKRFETAVGQMSVMGALMGSGVGVLYFEISQIGLALVFRWLQSQ